MTKKNEKITENKPKKLVINTETIRKLTATDLAKVVGGQAPTATGSRGEAGCP